MDAELAPEFFAQINEAVRFLRSHKPAVHVSERHPQAHTPVAKHVAELPDQHRIVGPAQPFFKHPRRFDGPPEIRILASQLDGSIKIILVAASHLIRRPRKSDIEMTVTENKDPPDRACALIRRKFVLAFSFLSEKGQAKNSDENGSGPTH